MTAARCTSAWLVLAFAALAALACRPSRDAEPSDEAKATQPEPSAPTDSPSPSWVDALDRALARGVLPSGTDDGSYRVDAFVAVLVFEHLRQTRGRPTFTAIDLGEDGEIGGGYRVGPLGSDSLYHRLGLREGDLIESINGVTVSSPDRFARALEGAENQVTVSLLRDGFSMTLSYRLVEARTWSRLIADVAGPGTDDAPSFDPLERQAPSQAPVDSDPPATPSTERPSPSTAPKPSPGSRPSPRASFASCESSSTCTVTKAHFDALVANPERLQSQADIVPAIRNDVHSGYRLRTVRPNSTVADLGFRSGDKITHVNGHDLTNDAQALQLYLSLAGSRVFNVRYERGSRRLVKKIVVQ